MFALKNILGNQNSAGIQLSKIQWVSGTLTIITVPSKKNNEQPSSESHFDSESVESTAVFHV